VVFALETSWSTADGWRAAPRRGGGHRHSRRLRRLKTVRRHHQERHHSGGGSLKVNEWAGQRLAEVLQQGVAHGLEPLLWTLRRAVEFRRWHAADVRSILASGGAAPSPQSASQY
jgi:hypothetical protein